MRQAHHSLPGTGAVVARLTLVAAPVVAFDTFDLPGIVTLGMLLPAVVLAAVYARTPGVRIPGWEFLLLATLTASVLWGDDPAYSTERLRTYLPLLLSTTLAGCLLAGETVLRCLKLAFVVILGSSVVTLLVDPATRFRGPGSSVVAVHAQFSKNEFGGLLVFALVLVIAERRRVNAVLIPVLLLLIALNQSVTAWGLAAVLIGAVCVSRFVVGRLGPHLAVPVLLVAGSTTLLGLLLLIRAESSSALELVGKDPTLSERTAIWAASWEQIKTSPLLGHGAFTFLDTSSNSPVTRRIWAEFVNYRPPHPHNGILDVWGQIGLLGLVAFAGLVMHGLRSGLVGVRLGRQPAAVTLLGLAFVLLYGLTEPAYLGPWLVLTLTCIAMADPPARTLAMDDVPDLQHAERVQ